MTSNTQKTKKNEGLYPYTLQPVALNMSESEFRDAQMALFEKTSQSVGIKSIRTKEWIVLGVLTVAAIAGLILVNGYSTIIFWIMLVLVGLYLVVRTLGLQWYMKREFEKQVAETAMPDEMNKIKVGVQSHGLIMTIPMNQSAVQTPHHMRGMQMRSAPVQQGVIPWSAVTSWDETDKFLFIMFELQGQKGSQILPKRLNPTLPITSITKHLAEVTPKGLKVEGMTAP